MKGTYCDPHLQNRNVKLCSHQPSPKETIWFSGIRLDRLPNVSFVSVFFFSPFLFICSAVQHFALFKHQQHSSCEKLCQLCFRELARKQKKLSRTTCAFSWETASPVAGTERVPCWHRGALYKRVGAACPRHLILPLTLCWRSWCRGFTHCSSGL